MEGERNGGPYKATKMWNEMVETFRNGVPLKRHRRHIKVYDNCFTGQEAANWFQSVLQNNLRLGNIVTREQTIQLLNKFLKAGVFQNINAAAPFDIHYQYLKEGDLYHLSDIDGTRLPLASKSLNIPPKTRPNRFSVKNADEVMKKGTTQSEMAVPRLDAHHTVGLPTTRSSITQTKEGNWNCRASEEEFRSSDQQMRNKIDAYPRKNMQCGTNYRKVNFNQVHKDYGSVQNGVQGGPNVENHSHCSAAYNTHSGGSSAQYSSQSSCPYENQLKGTTENYSRGYCVSSTEQGKLHSERSVENTHLRSEKINVCDPVNSRDINKDFDSSRPYADSCRWLEPLTLDSIDTFDVEKRISIQQSSMPSTTLGYKQLETSKTLPRSQVIQRSSSMIQPKPEPCKLYVNNTNHCSENSMNKGKLPQRSTDASGLTKPVHPDINIATVRRSPYLHGNNNDAPEEDNMMQGGSVNGKQIHNYPFSTSQSKCNQNNATIYNMQKERDPLRKSESLGVSRSDIDKPVMTPVLYPSQLLEIWEIWKKVVMTRFQKLTPGLEIPFIFDLQSIPGEWLAANASSEVQLQHDSQFPQSLVAAMNCLVHWPQAVPIEIITAFKEHYFKLQEPLTTFKLYTVLTKVFLYVATGNLAMSKGMVSRRSESSASGVLTMVLPPNSCFETAFTSDSPITRIVPQRSVDTLHFSRHGRLPKNIPPKRISSAPNLCEPLPNVQMAQKANSRCGTKRQVTGGRRAMKLANRKASRRVRIGVEEDTKLCHFRNKSGGYVNPALSQSIDDINADDFSDTARVRSQYNLGSEQELDYIAALESLNTLMKCSRRDNTSIAVGGQGIDAESDMDQNGSPSSESSSYYTAVSSSSSEASSRRSSGVLVDSLENVDTAGGTVHMNIGETGEKLMVSIMQLLLLCIPAYNRVQLRYLLHFMNQWNLHHSLCVQTDVVDIFTPTILRSECEANFDVTLARSIVYFLMSHHELVLSLPSDLEEEVQYLLTKQQADNVSRKGDNVTYCQQVSSRQFEQQRLTGSQLALSELLEQILSDCKMGPKEKRKRLKMFQESYPHIYRRRFPDSAVQEKAMKKQPRGLLNLATLSRLKSLRV